MSWRATRGSTPPSVAARLWRVLTGWPCVARVLPRVLHGRGAHRPPCVAGRVRAAPASGRPQAAARAAAVAGTAAHPRPLGVRRRGPLNRERPRTRRTRGVPGGGLRARAPLGAWGQRAPRPSARATARARAGPAPRAAVPAPSCTRAALDTQPRRRRRAGRPGAKAAASGRDSPDRPQAPGGRHPPSVAPRPADASPWLRLAARPALPGRRRPPVAWRWEPGAGSPTHRGGGARARAGGGRSPRDAGHGDTVGAVGPRASRHTGARERGACAVLFSVGSPLGPPVASCRVLWRLPSGPSGALGPAASPRTVEARGRDGSAWRLLVTWLFLTNHQTMCQVL